MVSKLGIIAGSGDLPREIARLQQESGGEVVIAAIDQKNSFKNFEHKYFALGAAGAILDYFKENSVEEIIIIGGVKRPDLKSLKVDFSGGVLISKILKQKILGDDNVLRIVVDHIESKGFKVISPEKILKRRGGYGEIIASKKAPSPDDKTDIEIGREVIKALGKLDVGQSVIVSGGYVVGIEAAEGTDNLIDRCALLRKEKKGGVLVKMSKSSQDMRLDVPVIGPDTIEKLAKNGFLGVAIEKTAVIIIDPEKTKILLDEHGMFLVLF
jgi:hypothetical protein